MAVHKCHVELLDLNGDVVSSVLTSVAGSYSFINIIPGQYILRDSHNNLNIEVKERGDGVAGFKRRRQDFQGDGVMNLTTASGRSRLKAAVEDSTWRQRKERACVYFNFPFAIKLAIGLNVFLQDPSPHGESLSEAWTCFKDLLQKVPHHGIDLWLQVQIFYDHVNLVTRRTIDQSAGGKLRDRNAKESWALLEDLALYDSKSWNDPRDFAKPVKAISLPQDVPSTSDCRLIELKNQVQHLMEAHLAPKKLIQVNKITSSCEICSGPHDTQYCMENPEQAFVDYASSRTDEAGERRLSSLKTQLGQQQDDMISKINLLWKAVSKKLDDTPTYEAKEEGSVKSNATENKDHEMTVESEEEF
ncbi:hypothetical protein Tco_1010796 [Tanacetum coccineum]